MSDDEQKALDTVKEAATIFKESLDAGMYLGKTCIPQLAIFVELGVVVRTVIGFSEQGKKDPVLEEITSLEQKLAKIEEKMKDRFEDLKAFVAEHSFYNDVPLASTLLFQSMMDALKTPGDDSQKEFREQCEATQPLEYSRRLKNQLAHATTNPLKMAITAHPLESADFFQKWKDIYDSLYTRLFFVEAMASGFLYEKNLYRVNLMKEEYHHFTKAMETWENDYRTNNHYWPDSVRKIVEDIQDKYTEKTSEEKAEIIRDKLEHILTDDVLYITVLRKSYDHVHYANLPDQNILSLNRGDCKIIVYRSRKAKMEHEKIPQFKKNVESFKIIRWANYWKYEWPSEERLKSFSTYLLKDSGFVLMVKASEHVGVQSTKKDLFPEGPGSHFYGTIRPRDEDMDAKKNWVDFFFISGYK